MEGLRSYFSFQGRTNRQRYWLTALAVFLMYLVGVLVAALFFDIPLVGGLMILAMVALTIWLGLALATRRLHDRNKSGWWLLPMYVPVVLLVAAAQLAAQSNPEASIGFSALSLPFSIWILVELGFLKGTTGPNRFGEDPLQPAPVEVFS